MIRLFLPISAAIMLMAAPSNAQQAPMTVQSCGTLANKNIPGSTGSVAVDINGRLCTSNVTILNVADYGAKCDGATDDTAAINSALSAARAHTSSSVKIVAPSDANAAGCQVTSVNATAINTALPVIMSGFTLLCSGAGNICLDRTGSSVFHTEFMTIIGNSSSPPEIGVQYARQTGAVAGGINSDSNLWVRGSFTLAACYNFASEEYDGYHVRCQNLYAATGPISAVGTITAGSGYVAGTYTNVPLTGGTGSGAVATIVVNVDGTVHAGGVTITYEGRDYTAADSLTTANTNLGNSGSGFAVAVSTVSPYALILDGENHWRATSTHATINLAVDTQQSFSRVSYFGLQAKQDGNGSLGAVWMAATTGMEFRNTYTSNSNTSGYGFVMFDNSQGSNRGDHFDVHNETNTLATFLWTGSNATPNVLGFYYKDDIFQSTASVFATSSSVTGAVFTDVEIHLTNTQHAVPFFDNALLYATFCGKAYLPSTTMWNAPLSNCAQVSMTTTVSPPNYGPVDIVASAGGAYSCSRLLNHSYTGPLCSVLNAAAATANFYPDANGNAPVSSISAFCAGSACTVPTIFDQSGNGNNCTQSTAGNQPVVVLADSAMGGKLTLAFGNAGAVSCSVAQSASINNVFATGGYVSAAVNQTGSPTQQDRLFDKTAIIYEYVNVGTTMQLTKSTNAVGGVFPTAGNLGANGGHIIDIQYDYSSLSNVPTIGFDGTTQTLGTVTTPTGTPSSDAANAMIIGSNAATGGIRGWPGNIAEIIFWKTTPSVAALEAVRRNEGLFYGLSTK